MISMPSPQYFTAFRRQMILADRRWSSRLCHQHRNLRMCWPTLDYLFHAFIYMSRSHGRGYAAAFHSLDFSYDIILAPDATLNAYRASKKSGLPLILYAFILKCMHTSSRRQSSTLCLVTVSILSMLRRLWCWIAWEYLAAIIISLRRVY